jgi:hypothetical protein
MAVDSGVYRTGIVLERKVATVLEQLGCRTSLLKHGSDKAPALLAWRGKVPLPHWQVRWADGGLTWLVVRSKSDCGYMRNLGDLRTTGIDWDQYRNYAEVERLTKKRVVVALVHHKQNSVVTADLHRHRVRGQGGGLPMFWWDFDRLERLCSYRDLENTVPRDQTLDEPLFLPPDLPPMQTDLFDGLA